MKMQVPWAKLYLGPEEVEAVNECFETGWVSMGNKVLEFERKMAERVGVRYAIAVNSGTAALDAALKCLNVAPGDEVIVPAFAYIATANCVLYQHAIPVFADIDPLTFNIDPADVKRKISPKTKGIIAIDYGGHPAEFDELQKISKDNNLFLIEDGAPGLGGSYKGKKLCSFGDIAITSFHAAKIFTTIEGGMIFTDNEEVDRKSRIIRSQGEDPNRKYHHPLLGHNFRMTDINAAIGLAQTSRMEEVLSNRAEAARFYTEHLHELPEVVVPTVLQDCTHAWFLYPVLIPRRDSVREILEAKGIGTNVFWPLAVYDQETFRHYKREICPVAEETTKKVLCLPLFYGITEKELSYVCQGLKEALAESA